MQKEVVIPNSLDEITVSQLMKFTSLKSEGEDAMYDVLNIFCNLTINEARALPYDVIEKAYKAINSALKEKPDHKKSFELNDKEWGFLPNINEITFGEYVDLDTYTKFEDEESFDYSTADKFMAVCYRPITKRFDKYLYEIEEYEGSEKYRKELRDAPASAFLGSLVFFCDLSNELLIASNRYLAEVETLHRQEDKCTGNGDGMDRFTTLQAVMYCDTRRLFSSLSKQLSRHFHTYKKRSA